MGAFKNLCAIVDTTKNRRIPLSLGIRGGPKGGFFLAITEGNKTLASVPFEPGQEDEAAEDVARQLTLDGGLPRGMDSQE